MVSMVNSLHREESGQALIEFALICLIVGLGAIAGMGVLASSINKVFTQVAGQLT
jgi:Flp pilus assembly pilin Flp